MRTSRLGGFVFCLFSSVFELSGLRCLLDESCFCDVYEYVGMGVETGVAAWKGLEKEMECFFLRLVIFEVVGVNDIVIERGGHNLI